MTRPMKSAPAGAGTPAGAENQPTTQMTGDSPTMMASASQPRQAECPSCTVPAANSTLDPVTGLCSFCADPPPPLDADALLAEADQLAAVLPTLLASRLASASQTFPGPEGCRVYVQSQGPCLSIAVTERDPDTRQYVTREFVATVAEVTR